MHVWDIPYYVYVLLVSSAQLDTIQANKFTLWASPQTGWGDFLVSSLLCGPVLKLGGVIF